MMLMNIFRNRSSNVPSHRSLGYSIILFVSYIYILYLLWKGFCMYCVCLFVLISIDYVCLLSNVILLAQRRLNYYTAFMNIVICTFIIFWLLKLFCFELLVCPITLQWQHKQCRTSSGSTHTTRTTDFVPVLFHENKTTTNKMKQQSIQSAMLQTRWNSSTSPCNIRMQYSPIHT